MNNVAIIPARGGSKRIPRKNIKPFCGKPMLAYPIEAALEAESIQRVVVSTDDPVIAATAEKLGAEAPFIRPEALADDFTTTVPVVKHAIEQLSQRGDAVDNVCCLYPTAPCLQGHDLDEAYRLLVGRQVRGYVFAAARMPFPWQRAFTIDGSGYCRMLYPENYAVRSQDLEETYQDAGQFYWGHHDAFLQEKIFFSPDSVPYLLPIHRVRDIDTHEDWLHAELLYRTTVEEGVL